MLGAASSAGPGWCGAAGTRSSPASASDSSSWRKARSSLWGSQSPSLFASSAKIMAPMGNVAAALRSRIQIGPLHAEERNHG